MRASASIRLLGLLGLVLVWPALLGLVLLGLVLLGLVLV